MLSAWPSNQLKFKKDSESRPLLHKAAKNMGEQKGRKTRETREALTALAVAQVALIGFRFPESGKSFDLASSRINHFLP
jgi:hypothetical protein